MVKDSLTHWGQLTQLCISKLTNIGAGNGLLPGQHQAIIWTNARILLLRPLGTNFSEILIETYAFSFKKIHLKVSSGKWWPFCLSLNVLTCTLLLDASVWGLNRFPLCSYFACALHFTGFLYHHCNHPCFLKFNFEKLIKQSIMHWWIMIDHDRNE